MVLLVNTINLKMNNLVSIPQSDLEEMARYHKGFGTFQPITRFTDLINDAEYNDHTPIKRSSIKVVMTSTECTGVLNKEYSGPEEVWDHTLTVSTTKTPMTTIKYEAKTILTHFGWRITWAASKDFYSQQELEATGTTVNQQVFQLNNGIEIPGLENRYVVNPDGTVTVVFDGYNPGGGGLDPVNPGGGGIIRSAPVIYMGGEYNDGYTLDL